MKRMGGYTFALRGFFRRHEAWSLGPAMNRLAEILQNMPYVAKIARRDLSLIGLKAGCSCLSRAGQLQGANDNLSCYISGYQWSSFLCVSLPCYLLLAELVVAEACGVQVNPPVLIISEVDVSSGIRCQ